MNSQPPILILFLFALAIMVVFTIRGITWNKGREARRLSRIKNIGLNKELRGGIIYPLFLAVTILYLSNELDFSLQWKSFGIFLTTTLAMTFLVSIFTNFPKPNAEQTEKLLRSNKQVKIKRLGGIVYFLISVLWVYSGYGKII